MMESLKNINKKKLAKAQKNRKKKRMKIKFERKKPKEDEIIYKKNDSKKINTN